MDAQVTPPYPANSAGTLMAADLVALPAALTVKEAIQRLRTMVRKRVPISYVYVVDDGGMLRGVLNMRDLMLAEGASPLEAIMTRNVVAVPATMDREEVVRLATQHPYLAIPVVDGGQRLVGTIKTADLLADAQEEATEDIVRMVGASEEEHVASSPWLTIRKRLPWLHVNLATAFLAAWVVGLFEQTIAQITVLAVFLPIVAGQGGNAGAQTLAVMIRGLVLGEVELRAVRPVLRKELLVGTVNGVIIGFVTAAIALAWHGSAWLGLVLGLAMIINMVIACLSGALIPLTMKALGRDPAQSSSILLTTITDVVGFFAFLGLATLFQHQLLPRSS